MQSLSQFIGAVLFVAGALVLAVDVEADTYPECPSNLTRFTEPLAYTSPENYTAHFYLVVHSKRAPHLTAGVSTMVKVDKMPADAPNVLVFNVDKSVELYSVSGGNMETKIVCRNSKSDALVIETRGKINDQDTIEVVIASGAPVRSDSRGIHKTENGIIKASFVESEARLIFPCFDGPSYKSVIMSKLDIDLDLEAASRVPEIERVVVDEETKTKTVVFDDTDKINLKDYAFEIHPAK